MSKRSAIVDLLGNELYQGDVVCWATRYGNRARQSVGIVQKTYVRRLNGRLYPFVKVQPGIADSGIGSRRSLRVEEVSTEHMVLIERADD